MASSFPQNDSENLGAILGRSEGLRRISESFWVAQSGSEAPRNGFELLRMTGRHFRIALSRSEWPSVSRRGAKRFQRASRFVDRTLAFRHCCLSDSR